MEYISFQNTVVFSLKSLYKKLKKDIIYLSCFTSKKSNNREEQ